MSLFCSPLEQSPQRRLAFIPAAALAVASCSDRELAPIPTSVPPTTSILAALPLAKIAPTPIATPPARVPGDASPQQPTPYLPPQCYTMTEDAQGRVHNPCFTCHVDSASPNYIRDGELQLSYALGPPARVNPWTNLFVDRRSEIAAISDEAILRYVRHDNYRGNAHRSGLAARLRNLPAEWDSDANRVWSAWIPDIAFDFDDHGFDRREDRGYTGWRAYAYFPVPGTFWPTNGSYGDAMIRLPQIFREDRAGNFDLVVYMTNLAITEAMIARRDIPIDPTDENRVGVDLDGDGRRGLARAVRYRWKPSVVDLTWAGRAGPQQAPGERHCLPGMFPVGTEFAHSVRYLDVVGGSRTGRVVMAARMKELRYMVKQRWVSPASASVLAWEEAREKEATPQKTRVLIGTSEHGLSNNAGWRMRGFIEDADGELRPQTLAELGYCIGCHSGVGATDDSVFSFGRKLSSDRFRRGWYHASQRGIERMPEPVRADGRGEYTLYLTQNGAGDEFRENQEVLAKFFDARGALRPDMASRLKRDISLLLLPSPGRALLLNKAYRVIVSAQSFTYGRDATATPVHSVHRELPAEPRPTGILRPIPDRRDDPRRRLTDR